MNHETARTRLDALVDGELTAGERAEVDAHLAGCPECRDEAAALRRLRSGARALVDAVEPVRDLWPGIATRIAGAPVAAPRRRSWFEGWTQGLAWAAVLAVALVGAYRLLAPVPEAPPRTAAMPAGLIPAVGALEMQTAAAGKELQAALALRPEGMDAATGAALAANLDVSGARDRRNPGGLGGPSGGPGAHLRADRSLPAEARSVARGDGSRDPELDLSGTLEEEVT